MLSNDYCFLSWWKFAKAKGYFGRVPVSVIFIVHVETIECNILKEYMYSRFCSKYMKRNVKSFCLMFWDEFNIGKPKKKVSFSGPAAKALPPFELSSHIFWGIFFLVPPPPRSGRATKKKTFRRFPYVHRNLFIYLFFTYRLVIFIFWVD